MEGASDSRRPEFWESRIRAGRIPWDMGGIPAELSRYLAATPSSGGRALIPGCGTAYEVAAFRKAGYDVVGIDFCEAAVEMARRAIGDLADAVCLGDFFTHGFQGRPFDLIYERAFLCSMPPSLWPRYARRVRELLPGGGLLLGYFYRAPMDEDGPPFGLAPDEPGRLLGEGFRCLEDLEVRDSLPVYAGGERWQVWRFRDV